MTWLQLGILIGVILIISVALCYRLIAVEFHVVRVVDALAEIGVTLKRIDSPDNELYRIEEELKSIARDTSRVRRRYAPTDAELADQARDKSF